jgi:hypothetical protein
LLIFLGLNKSKNKFLIRAQCWARSSPRLQPTGRSGLLHAAGRKPGWASAWQPGPTETWPTARERARDPGVLTARSPRATHARDGMVACSPAARWWLAGGKVLLVSSWGHREGTGQGGRGWSSPERRRSGGCFRRRRWRHDPAVSVRKREGEGGL